MACVVVVSLMRTLELEFLQPLPRPILQQNQLIPCNKHLVLSLHKKLGFLMEQLDENRMDGVEAIKELETKLRDVASRIEDEIELQVLHLYEEEEEEELRNFKGIFDIFYKTVYHTFEPPEMPQGEKSTHRCQSLNLDQIRIRTHRCQRLHQILHPKSHPCLKFRRILHPAIQHIDAITEELGKAKEEYELFKHHLQAGTKQPASLHVLPKPDDEVITASHSQEIMVGKQDEFKIIKKMLIEHPSKQQEIVSIKGMGGIGKTTLARKIYEDSSITSYFDKRAWVVASQHHNKRQMLLGLLGFKDNNAGSSTDEDLALQLYQSLKHQRYLVVMDDLWSVEAWDAVKACFPDDRRGSRVLLTTRLAKVANHICSKDDFSHQMQFLEQSESWQLFYEKACKSRGAEFETIGRPVVEKCKGLPLAIIVVAGLFSKLNTLEKWKNTANALSSSSATTLDDEECSRILSFSYNHLPFNLKACFLYLGVFPEDHEIKANNLARLWHAEGLVKAFENENLDAVANRYLQELMDRNLIILSELCSRGRKIKRFRMHDLLHAFCVREAQNENLLHVVQSENSSYFPQRGFRWVSIQYEDFDMSTIQDFTGKSYRSFFNFVWKKSFSNFKKCNLLRVLFCSDNSVWIHKIVDTVHLRFLRVGNYIELVREFLKLRHRKSVELSKSWNLQTLDCFRRVSYRLDEGRKNLEFPQLHYICCSEDYFCGNPPNFVHKLVGIRAEDCSEEYITNIPCLKKVCIECDGSMNNAYIANFAYLEQLEGLQISSRPNSTHNPTTNDIVLLKNIRKLALSGMGFEWEKINILSELPRLEVLKLLWNSCVDKEWEIQEEVKFCQLITLALSQCFDFKHWKASSHNFPKLEHLFLRSCNELREIPIDFAEIPTWKSIKLCECLPSAVESAKKIQDEQCEYGNNDMVVIEERTLNVSKSEKILSEEEAEVDNC